MGNRGTTLTAKRLSAMRHGGGARDAAGNTQSDSISITSAIQPQLLNAQRNGTILTLSFHSLNGVHYALEYKHSLGESIWKVPKLLLVMEP